MGARQRELGSCDKVSAASLKLIRAGRRQVEVRLDKQLLQETRAGRSVKATASSCLLVDMQSGNGGLSLLSRTDSEIRSRNDVIAGN